MKLLVDCECVILQRTLEIFLKDYTTPYDLAEFIISDRKIKSKKPIFLIGEKSPYLDLPFSKEKLLSILEEYHFAIKNYGAQTKENNDLIALEERVIKLIDEFKGEILELIRNQNGK